MVTFFYMRKISFFSSYKGAIITNIKLMFIYSLFLLCKDLDSLSCYFFKRFPILFVLTLFQMCLYYLFLILIYASFHRLYFYLIILPLEAYICLSVIVHNRLDYLGIKLLIFCFPFSNVQALSVRNMAWRSVPVPVLIAKMIRNYAMSAVWRKVRLFKILEEYKICLENLIFSSILSVKLWHILCTDNFS